MVLSGITREPGVAPNQMVSTDVLDTVHGRLVAVHAGLAEHGPSDPKLAVPWTLDELTTVPRYIRAIRKGEPADLPD
jgi:hypothetical protein